MRLIDADKILARIKPYDESDESWACTGGTAIKLLYKAINEAPTVDAVEIVRCKDCVYHRELNQSEKEYYNENALICTNSYFLESTVVESDDFCRYGKREVLNG